VPGTNAADYVGLAALLLALDSDTIEEKLDSRSEVYRKLMHPILLAALNCQPREGSARLASAVVRETLARGGMACRPLIASHGLGPALVEPAIGYIKNRGGEVRFDHALRTLEFVGTRLFAAKFDDGPVALAQADSLILAVPAWVARTLVPNLTTPTEYRSILNAHFKVKPPAGLARISGIVNATTEWLFAFDDRLSVTVSAADRFNETEREPLARQIWSEIVKITGLAPELPRWHIVKERRATFAATPAQNALRPPSKTRWENFALAGDWTATGLPATIEGAIRSGETAAKLVAPAHF
jgi:hypothetical protein